MLVLIGTTAQGQTLQEGFQKTVDSVFAAHPEAIGFAVHVEAPDEKISWSYAVGLDGKYSSSLLRAEQPVLIASNTKPYVAATILRLIEQKKLKMNQPISGLLTESSKKELINAGYQLDRITLLHLLSHTSGIRDYVDEGYFTFITANKTHTWTRDEQIVRAASLGNPLAKAGESFHYADVNYVLLTEIIEKTTKQPFYKAMRSLLRLKKQHLNDTWFIRLEETPKKALPMAHQYWSRFSWDIDSLNPSWDLYGGGGIASNVEEMALFFQYLFNGKIVKNSDVLALMTQDVPPEGDVNYCLGIRKISLGGIEEYNHGGGLGTDVVYVPSLNASIAIVAIDASQRPVAVELSKELVRLLNWHQ